MTLAAFIARKGLAEIGRWEQNKRRSYDFGSRLRNAAILLTSSPDVETGQYIFAGDCQAICSRSGTEDYVSCAKDYRRLLFFSHRLYTTLTWNSLPHAVLNCESLSTFKSRLKTRMFYTALC